jgi:hypothetical protein
MTFQSGSLIHTHGVLRELTPASSFGIESCAVAENVFPCWTVIIITSDLVTLITPVVYAEVDIAAKTSKLLVDQTSYPSLVNGQPAFFREGYIEVEI